MIRYIDFYEDNEEAERTFIGREMYCFTKRKNVKVLRFFSESQLASCCCEISQHELYKSGEGKIGWPTAYFVVPKTDILMGVTL